MSCNDEQRKPVDFCWTEASEKAAELLALGELSDTAIAEEVGVNRCTLWRWRRNAEFSKRVESHLEEIRAEIRRHGIGVVERRVAALDDRWHRLRRVMEERGASKDMQDVPGGPTGLLVRKYRSVGSGENADLVEEFFVDTGLLSELREHERQAAQELGQWLNKTDVTTKGDAVGGPIFHLYSNGRGPTSGETPRVPAPAGPDPVPDEPG